MACYKQNVRQFLKAIFFCVKVSWNASKMYFVCRVFIALCNVYFPMLTLFLNRRLVDNLVNLTEASIVTVLTLLCSTLLINASLRVLGRVGQYVQSIHNELVRQKVQTELISKSSSLDVDFFDSPEYLNNLQAVQIDSVALQNMTWSILTCISNLVSLISAVILITRENRLYALLIIVADIPFALVSQKFARDLYKWRVDHLSQERQLSYIQGITTNRKHIYDVRIFGLKDFFIKKYSAIWEILLKDKKRVLKRQNLSLGIVSVLPELCVLAVSIHIIFDILIGDKSLGDLTLISGLMSTLTSSMLSFASSISSIYSDKLRIEEIRNFYNIPQSVVDSGTHVLDSINSIEFRNVSFKYPNSSKYVIENISFFINKGDKVCLVGKNGSGKSTIIKLMLRFYDVSTGKILINSRSITEYKLASLRNAFTALFQQYDIFSYSLRENIAISDLKKSCDADSEIISALERVGASELLAKCNYNLDIPISKQFDINGFEVSGGEAQKIALARSIYRNRSAIIFDEPTAAIDPLAEKQFFSNIIQCFEEQILIYTTHRMASVHIATKILVVDHGQLVENGTHEELLSKNGIYAELYNAQH